MKRSSLVASDAEVEALCKGIAVACARDSGAGVASTAIVGYGVSLVGGWTLAVGYGVGLVGVGGTTGDVVGSARAGAGVGPSGAGSRIVTCVGVGFAGIS